MLSSAHANVFADACKYQADIEAWKHMPQRKRTVNASKQWCRRYPVTVPCHPCTRAGAAGLGVGPARTSDSSTAIRMLLEALMAGITYCGHTVDCG